jgi:hypothetical protein
MQSFKLNGRIMQEPFIPANLAGPQEVEIVLSGT